MLWTFFLLGCCCSFTFIAAQRRPQPGDYPALRTIPRTSFDCRKRSVGYYADPDPTTRCQVYHMCDMKGNKFSYLCPNGTLFHQQHLICAHWYQVNCTRTLELYKVNKQMFPFEKFDSGLVSNNPSTEYVVPLPSEAKQPPQSLNVNKPVVHEVKLKESGWKLKPASTREQNGINGNTNLNADVHVPISSARAILESSEQKSFHPSSDVPQIITQLVDQTTNIPRSANFRGRTKFASSRSHSQVTPTSRTTLEQSRAATQTTTQKVPIPDTGHGPAVFGEKSTISTLRPSVPFPSFVPPANRRNNIRNLAQQQPSQTQRFAVLLPTSPAPSRLPSIRTSWEVNLPLDYASSEREQFAVTLEEDATDSVREQPTATPRAARATTPWTSLRATKRPHIIQRVSNGNVQTTSTDLENQGEIAPTQAPFDQSQSDLEGNPEKTLEKVTKLTMTFPKGGFFKKYSILPLNEKCPLCNPYFLKNGQCFPCVTIR